MSETGLGESARHWLARWLFSPLQGACAGDWFGALASNHFAVDPVYWPRAAFMSLTSVANSAMARIEDARWGEAIDAAPVRAPLFVLGHHRSGTTHLWNLLSLNATFAYPNVPQSVFPHTFLSFERIAGRAADHLAMRRRPQDNVRIDPQGPSGEEKALCAASFCSIQMAQHFPRRRERYLRFLTMREASHAERRRWGEAFHRFARKLVVRYGADKTLVFRAPDHTAKIALIREVFPDARFVHIHRDPYQVFSSTRWLEAVSQPMFAFQRPTSDYLTEFVLWRYRTMYDAFFDDVRSLPAHCFSEVGFDELLQDPLGVVRRIHHDLALPGLAQAEPAMQAHLDHLSGYRRNRYHELEPDLRERVGREWRPSFERWGYAI